MSLIPLLASQWWDCKDFPTRIVDQDFGVVFTSKDVLDPTVHRGYLVHPRTRQSIDKSGHSDVINDKDKFQIFLNMNHFKPEDIEVKTVDDTIVVHGKHEERSDGHGCISREFTRRYMLPGGANPETVKSYLKEDGVLVIEAPKTAVEPPPPVEREVPITMGMSVDG